MELSSPSSPRRNISVIRDVELPAEFLWRTLSDFGHIDRWSNIRLLAVTGHGIGATRTVEMPSGLTVTERLDMCDETIRTMRYSVVPPNPYPMTSYSATVRIETLTPLHSRIHWSGIYRESAANDPDKMRRLLHKIYDAGINLLIEHYADSMTPHVP